MVALSSPSRGIQTRAFPEVAFSHIRGFYWEHLGFSYKTNGYFKLETVRGRPVQGASIKPKGGEVVLVFAYL